ncbi:Structural maintenance of chromosomes protein 6 [Coelomomyces lativittatus]|nr:Structural maintenance of chromosomes protein 6 [Coelomomyces lativittatus]
MKDAKGVKRIRRETNSSTLVKTGTPPSTLVRQKHPSSFIHENGVLSEKWEAGFVQSLEVMNFMTHANLHLSFGPKINFLSGQNGSGKSAILASIMIALGGKASLTGRGNNLKDLIQYGKNVCTMKVRLCNVGPNAFKPDELGESILVERKISRFSLTSGGHGSSQGYTIRNGDEGGVYSERKKELDEILDHFHFHVDNPLTFLTQEASKEFLMNVNETSLYQFFAKGADIDVTYSNLNDLNTQLADMGRHLERIQLHVRHLRSKRKEKKEIHDTLVQSIHWFNELQQLQKEKKLCHLAQVQRDLSTCQKKLEENETLLKKHQMELIQAKDSVQNLETEMQALQQGGTNTRVTSTLLEKETEKEKEKEKEQDHETSVLQEKKKQHQKKLNELNTEIEHYKDLVASHQRKFHLLEQQMQSSSTSSSSNTSSSSSSSPSSSMTTLQEKLKTTLDACEKINKDIESLVAKKMNGVTEMKTLDLRIHQLEPMIHAMENEVKALEKEKVAFEQIQHDHLATWGPSVPWLLSKIKHMSWKGQFPPLGPLGQFVQPKKEFGNTWLPALREVLGKSMRDFLVESHEDRIELSKLFVSVNHKANILVHRLTKQGGGGGGEGKKKGGEEAPFHAHRLESGRPGVFASVSSQSAMHPSPSSSLLTMLDVLDITSERIQSALMVHPRIDRILLVHDRKQGETLALSPQLHPLFVAIFTKDGFSILANRNGTKSITAPSMLFRRGPCPFGTRWSTSFSNTESSFQDKAQHLQSQLDDKKREMDTFRQQRHQLNERANQQVLQLEQLRQALHHAQHEKEVLEEEWSLSLPSTTALASSTSTMSMTDKPGGPFQQEKDRLTQQLLVLEKQLSGLITLESQERSEYETCVAQFQRLQEQQRQSEEINQQHQHERLEHLNALSKHLMRSRRQVEYFTKQCEETHQRWVQDQATFATLQTRWNDVCQTEGLDPTAMSDGPLTQPLRTEHEVNDHIEQLQKNIDQVHQRYPQWTQEKSALDYETVQQAYVQAKHQQETLTQLHLHLRQSSDTRAREFEALKLHISTAASCYFTQRMASRKLEGTLIFSHTEKALHVKIQLDEPEKKKKNGGGGGPSIQREMASFSGGEKSFSTVCLLLSLWDAVPSPLRCMDEFDVYMDEINRAIAMQQLMSAAKESSGCQYLFITPLSLRYLFVFFFFFRSC